jgi:hypothetical protein
MVATEVNCIWEIQITTGDKMMMRTSYWIVAFAAVVVSQCRLRAEEKATPQRTLQQWCGALEAGAQEEIVACYENSDDVAVILSWGEMRTGIAEVHREFESAFHPPCGKRAMKRR